MPHIHDKIDFTVEVFLVHNNKVLLRKHDKYKKWLSVGGHIELDEDPNEAAIREVREEVGIDIILDDHLKSFKEVSETKELIPPYFMNRNRISETHEHVTLVYFAKSPTSRIVEGENEKRVECKWFSKEELEKDPIILPHIKHYALTALKTLGE